MVEIRGRQPTVTRFEDDQTEIKIERGDDIEVRVDATGKAHSSATKIYLTAGGLERVVRNGDLFYIDNKLKCSVIDTGETSFTVRAKENGIIPSEASVVVPEKHTQLEVIKEEDVSDLLNISKLHKIDFISVPFVSAREDLSDVTNKLKDTGLDSSLLLSRIDDRRGLDEFW